MAYMDEREAVRQVIDRLAADGHIPLYGFLAGSHLFGTATPDSDRDYVIVYAPNPEWLLDMRPIQVGKYRFSTNPGHAKNTSNDVDVQAVPIHTILKGFYRGDTNAIDWVFAPTRRENIVHHHRGFERGLLPFVESGELCIHRLDGAVGYAVHQAAKYGIKGSRLGDAIALRQALETVDPDMRIHDVLFVARHLTTVEVVPVGVGNAFENGLRVMGRTLHPRTRVGQAIEWLDRWIERYGVRARMAMENRGIDWKAISHAFRACEEARQYATTGMVRFPLQNAEFLKRVKAGEFSFAEVARGLELALDEVRGLPLPPCASPMSSVRVYERLGIAFDKKVPRA